MKRLIFILMLGVWNGGMWAGGSFGPAAPQRYRETLARPKEIQGHPCAKGFAWFYPDGRLASCALERDADFGVAQAPAGSWITLNENGRPKILQLVRDTRILSYMCRGGNRLLGPSEGAMTSFYPSGKLEECWLADDQNVQGIPCARSGMFTGYSSVQFYESGKLRSCKLSRDYGKLRRGERFVQAP